MGMGDEVSCFLCSGESSPSGCSLCPGWRDGGSSLVSAPGSLPARRCIQILSFTTPSCLQNGRRFCESVSVGYMIIQDLMDSNQKQMRFGKCRQELYIS